MTAVTVSPADDDPMPVVNTDLGMSLAAYCRMWDLAVPGSPTISRWDSPLTLVPEASTLATPPARTIATAILTKYRPYTWGHIEAKMRSRPTRGVFECCCQNCRHSSWVSLVTNTAAFCVLHTCRWLAFSTSSISERFWEFRFLQRRLTIPLCIHLCQFERLSFEKNYQITTSSPGLHASTRSSSRVISIDLSIVPILSLATCSFEKFTVF